MNYKDKTFEINDEQIKFKNKTLVLFIVIYTPILISSLFFPRIGSEFTTSSIIGAIVGLIIGLVVAFLILRLFVGIYLKSTISLKDIDYVKVQVWDKSIDKNRDFWGTGKYKYHFPTGINKKTNPNVIFVHIKNRKAAVGFVPENRENVVAVLKERGIKVIEKTT